MISFREVIFRYGENSEPVLKNLNLTLPNQGFIAIMGANGSGKSTAALCMNGLLHPASGEVIVDGLTTGDAGSLPEIRRRVGVVFQNPQYQFTSLTVERELAFGLENIGMERSLMQERVHETVGLFGIGEFLSAAPSSLSGGEQQRVAVAAVSILRPRYFVLDEVTSFLAPSSRKEILSALMAVQRARQSGMILITQFPDEAMQADRLIVLSRGTVLLDGSPHEVLNSADILRNAGVPVSLRSRMIR